MILERARRLNWHTGLVGAALATLVGLICLWFPYADKLVDLSYDLAYLARPQTKVDGVVMVYMDEESLRTLNQNWFDSWNRGMHAALIDRLTREQAKAVVFDVLFLRSNDPALDQLLVKAAQASGRVIVAARSTPHVHDGQLIGYQLTRPFPELQAVTQHGVVEEATGGMIRAHFRHPLQNEPSLAWRAAQLVGTKGLPRPDDERWLNYYGPPGCLPSFSYHHCLATNLPLPRSVSNQVVFVGARYDSGYTGGKGTDDFLTPYTHWTGRKSPGADVNATAFLNLINREWLRRLPPIAEVGLLISAAVIFGVVLASCRPVKATVIAALGAVLATVVCLVLFWQAHLFLPWLVMAVIQIPAALGVAVLGHTGRLQSEKKSLEQVFALLNKGDTNPTEEDQTTFAALEERLDAIEARVATGQGDSARQGSGVTRVESQPKIPDHELICRIGSGAYGEVWLAKDIIGTFHAVKIVYRSNFRDAAPMEREFNGLRKFTPISRSHPGFVHILHVGRSEQPECIYYMMELGDDEHAGQTIDPSTYSPKNLAKELQKRRRLPLSECVQIGLQLTDALGFLHQHNLIHRDIKSANILFVRGQPKFGDIGLVTDVAHETKAVTYVGTPGHIAPEGPGTPAADLFSFGKVLYEMGMGLAVERFPEIPTSLIESADEEGLFLLNRVILRACDLDVRRRYQSAEALRQDLVELRSKVHLPAQPDPTVVPPPRG